METYRENDIVGRIEIDETPENPRKTLNNLGTMFVVKGRGGFDLGDELFDNEDELINHAYHELTGRHLEDELIDLEDDLVEKEAADIDARVDMERERLIDDAFTKHVVVRISVNGCCGFIFAREGAEGLDDDKIRENLEAEVDTYVSYLNGEVYGFTIERETVCGECGTVKRVELDSCWGFYGSDMEYVRNEMRSMAEHYAAKNNK